MVTVPRGWSSSQRPSANGKAESFPLSRVRGRTELANAARLVRKHGKDLRYVEEWQEWVVWNGKRWSHDRPGVRVQEMAAGVARSLWDLIPNPDSPDNSAERQMVKFAQASATAKGVRNMVTLARSVAGVPVSAAELDKDPWLLNCPNGVVDLRTGKLRDHRREDYMTKMCPTPYDPEACCPAWQQFLADVFQGDALVIGFLRRFLGYCLTGNVREQVLPIFWGDGANGKSTLVEAVMHVLGEDYSGPPPRDLFALSRGERHPTQLMTLKGRRVLMSQETDTGCRLNEALVKHLTGGDTVTARPLYKDFSSFAPTHKLVLCTNHKPEVRGRDLGVWRRLRLVPFRAKFEGKGRVKSMLQRLKAEAAGILAWMVEGCREWQLAGLLEPKSVLIATQEYADEQDVIEQFLKDVCELGDEFETEATELYEAFKRAVPDGGMSQTAFGRALGKRGFESGRVTTGPTKGRKTWKGIKLLG
jgi:putative DNA primase/helicase